MIPGMVSKTLPIPAHDWQALLAGSWHRARAATASGIGATAAVAVVSTGAALALVIALAAPPAAAAAPANTIQVPTAVVGSQGSSSGFEIEATLQAVQQSTVSARVGGSMLQLAVKVGQAVKAGQLLARVDDRELQAAVAAGDAAVAQAQAAQTQAQQQLQRQRDLRAQGFLSAAALDSATAQAQAAAAAVLQAQALRQQATLARGFASVTAPFDGVVLATHIEAGELATPGRPLLTLYAPGRLRAVVQLPSSRAQAARAAQTTEVILADGRRITPSSRQELPGADAVSQTTEWRLELPASVKLAPSAATPATPAASSVAAAAAAANTSPNPGLQPGQSVRVRFAGAPAGAGASTSPARLAVPASAVLHRGELQAVYVAQEGRFVLKAVRLGAASGTQQEVLAGLKSGERIALDPVRAGLAGAVPAAQ